MAWIGPRWNIDHKVASFVEDRSAALSSLRASALVSLEDFVAASAFQAQPYFDLTVE